MTLEEMTLEDALDMVLRQAEKSECNVKALEMVCEDARKQVKDNVKALEMVEDAVLRYMKIQKEFKKLQDIIKKKERYSRCVYRVES